MCCSRPCGSSQACTRSLASSSSLLNTVTVSKPFTSHAGTFVTHQSGSHQVMWSLMKCSWLFGRFGSAHKPSAHLHPCNSPLLLRGQNREPPLSKAVVWQPNSSNSIPCSESKLPFHWLPHVYRQTAMAKSSFSNTSFQSISLQSSRVTVNSY